MNTHKPVYEYKKMSTKDISVDPLYQRELSKSRVAKIVKNFNPYLVNACKVSFRDGKYWVFDGQHTIAAVKAKYGGRDTQIDCKVFYGLTEYEEMELFIAQNGISSSVKFNEKCRALFNNGDPDVVGMVRACESVGIEIDFSHVQARNRIIALSTLMKVYKGLQENQFTEMLTTIRGAWGGRYEGYCAEILAGMGKFYDVYYGEFDKKRLLRVLSKSSPIEIVRDGKVSSSGGNTRYARVILGIYNKGTSTNKLEDKL